MFRKGLNMGKKKIELVEIIKDIVYKRNDYYVIKLTEIDKPIIWSQQQYDKKVKKYGSIQEAVIRYNKRKPKEENNESVETTPIMIKKESPPKKEPVIFNWKGPRPATPEDLTKNGTCMYPDIFFNNGKYCNSCPIVKKCLAKCRRI